MRCRASPIWIWISKSLRALGVQFVKLDAQVFLQGLTCSGQTIPSSDICRHFDDLGLQVIVSGIDSARVRLRVEGCGVAYGQGTLFGGPRQIPVGNPAGAQHRCLITAASGFKRTRS